MPLLGDFLGGDDGDVRGGGRGAASRFGDFLEDGGCSVVDMKIDEMVVAVWLS